MASQQNFSRSVPSRKNRSVDPARTAAFETIRTVSSHGAYGNLALPEKIRAYRLNKRDAALATELTYGTLRWQGSYDKVISVCVDRPLTTIDAAILDVLRLGSHQLLNTRIAAHAAVDQSVSLARNAIGAGPAQLVNAVLRKISTRTLQEWCNHIAETEKITDEIAKLGIELAHPGWIIRAFKQALTAHGNQKSELKALLSADNEPPAVNLVVLDNLGDPAELLAAGAKLSPLTSAGLIYSDGDLRRFAHVRAGKIRVQDVGSQLVTRIFAAASVEGATGGGAERWADLCAGPGGKTALLAALAQKKGRTVHATEINVRRAGLVKQALAVFPEKSWSVHTGDGREIGERSPSGFDKILLDAPCSGLGALRRRPEARWRKQPEEIPELTKLQRQLTDSAFRALKPGGVLGFVVCSPHIAETILLVNDVLKAYSDALLEDAPSILKHMTTSGTLPDGYNHKETFGAVPSDATKRAAYIRERTLQLWPHVHGTDAMFLALIRKKGKKG